MFGMNWDEFWWANITGPNIIVTNVVMALLEIINVVLKVPSDLPWRHSLRSAVESVYNDRSSTRGVIIEFIDAADENPDSMEPGKFILQRFADETTKRSYRDKSKISIQQYISTKAILKNRIVWVKGLSKQSADPWLAFCKEFSPMTPDEGLFVLEVHGEISCKETKRLRLVDYSQFVSRYDVQLLNSFILDDQQQWSNAWKQYISAVTATVSDTDAEISELLLRTVSYAKQTLIEGLSRVAALPEYSNRGTDDLSEHVLKDYRSGNTAEINRRIWSAQVQTLFPIIELERIEIINRYHVPIQQALLDEKTCQYGKVITDPIEVELGTLCYLMNRRKEDALYSLYLPDETARDRIRFLHECRNKLAHVECCSPQQVAKLLKTADLCC